MKKSRGTFQGVPHPKDPTERSVERYLCKRVQMLGGLAIKMEVPGHRFLPDRLCVMPRSIIAWCEVKQRRGRLSKGQQNKIKILKKMGHICEVVWCYEDVDVFISLLQTTDQFVRLGDLMKDLNDPKKAKGPF